ncbi:MAG: SAM-dependent chlorinase/fluorinase [Thermoflavifilum sp.]|nr:SAM-dependent chlorinase/fluorinase [Thermoflavifilum sp.]
MKIITLTSDMGLQDYLVAAIKGQLIQHCPECQLMDISHQIEPLNLLQTAYVVKNVWKHFPAGTLHMLFVDLYYQPHPRYMLAHYQGHFFCGADNGVLPMVFDSSAAELYELPIQTNAKLWDIVHGFAHVAQVIFSGKPLVEIGKPTDTFSVLESHRARMGDDWIEAQIIFIDHYENVIVNITYDEFETYRRGRKFKIYFRHGEYITELNEQYAQVKPSEKLALFNAGGYLEIAINRGNAAGLLGLRSMRQLKPGESTSDVWQKKLFYQTIKIIFET